MACCTILSTQDAWGISSARTVAFTSLPNWEDSPSRPTLNRPHGIPKKRMKRFFLSVQEESTFRPQHRTSVTHQCFPLTNFPVLPAVMNDGSFIAGKFGQKHAGYASFFQESTSGRTRTLSPTFYKSMKNKSPFSRKNTRSMILKLFFPKWRTNLIQPFPLYWQQAD